MKALITGATGFLGGVLTLRLYKMGWDVTALGRNLSVLKKLDLDGIKTIQANLEGREAILNAASGKEIVFHCGALSAPWGKSADFHKANVIGTENVIRACLENNVKRLVHVSTPSIYFRYDSRINVKEDAEIPKPMNEYAKTKKLAEDKVDAAYKSGLPVITIRPRAIIGPGDTSILPRLLPRLQSGRLPVIGDGENIVDLTYVENVVDALILCADSNPDTFGKKYNITNGEPVKLWKMIEGLCKELNLKYPTRKIPYKVADTIAAMLETIYLLIPGQPEPPLTRYSVFVVSQSATLDITAAQRDLNYKPRFSLEEGFQEFIHRWKNQ